MYDFWGNGEGEGENGIPIGTFRATYIEGELTLEEIQYLQDSCDCSVTPRFIKYTLPTCLAKLSKTTCFVCAIFFFFLAVPTSAWWVGTHTTLFSK